jgi:hypothetical protein
VSFRRLLIAVPDNSGRQQPCAARAGTMFLLVVPAQFLLVIPAQAGIQ